VDFGIEKVLSGEPIQVVERPGDCGPVVAAAFWTLNDELLSGTPVTRSNQNWAVLRYGPYYVIPIYSPSSERVAIQGYGQVLIFQVEGLLYLSWFLG